MSIYLNWRIVHLPCKMTTDAIKLLNTGCMYIHGRDRKFRPCFVVDAVVFQTQKLISPELFTLEVLTTAVVFLMEFVQKNMLLPGQVDYWVDIFELSKLSIKDLPTKEIGSLIHVLQTTYMYVLARVWMLNATAFQHFCFKVFEIFIHPETREKI